MTRGRAKLLGSLGDLVHKFLKASREKNGVVTSDVALVTSDVALATARALVAPYPQLERKILYSKNRGQRVYSM